MINRVANSSSRSSSRSSKIGGIRAGPLSPVRIMGVINSSPESFYKGSVHTTKRAIRDRAGAIEAAGGDYVDVGGMSTAPYLNTMVSQRAESERVIRAVKAVQDGCNLPISVDTCRAAVAQGAMEEGASILNDVSGLKYDDGGGNNAAAMAETARRYGASVILGAYGGPDMAMRQYAATSKRGKGNAVDMAKELLAQSLRLASEAGIPASKTAIDPSIGFFRGNATGPFYTKTPSSDWVSRDVDILRGLPLLRSAAAATSAAAAAAAAQAMPIVVSVSNKSFLGSITGRKRASERTYGSVAAETIAVINGADIIRTHNVEAARDAVSVASRFAFYDGRRRRTPKP